MADKAEEQKFVDEEIFVNLSIRHFVNFYSCYLAPTRYAIGTPYGRFPTLLHSGSGLSDFDRIEEVAYT